MAKPDSFATPCYLVCLRPTLKPNKDNAKLVIACAERMAHAQRFITAARIFAGIGARKAIQGSAGVNSVEHLCHRYCAI